jgi:superfamily I DNA/RNA helicase
MSLHKSKGLTAQTVIVSGFAEGMIPFVNPTLPPAQAREHLQEQRRLFFVALTRATHTLLLSSSKRLRRQDARAMGLDLPATGGFTVQTAPSSFADQLGTEGPRRAEAGERWLAGQLA